MKKLKILTEFGCDSHKSLLIELDKSIVDQLSIDENGMVATSDFIRVCLTELGYPVQIGIEIKDGEPNLEQLIFDTSIAVDIRKRQ